MAKTTNPRQPTKEIYRTGQKPHHHNHHNQPSSHHHKAEKPPPLQPPSWSVMKSILTCKHLQVEHQQHQQQPQQAKQKQKKQQKQEQPMEENSKKSKKMKCSGSLCNNTKVMQRPEPSASSPEVLHKKRASSSSLFNNVDGSSNRSIKSTPLKEINSSNNGVVGNGSSASSSSLMSVSSSSNVASSINNGGGSFKGMPFTRLSGCSECRMVVDPVLGFARDPALRATVCSCPQCGEIFMKAEQLDLHQAVRHAVSELGPEDTSKNIVEIIFQSSWLKKQTPVCEIDRILKVHNTPKTISKFEEYRDSIKAKATKSKLPKKHPRCIADGNELLRFHCTTFMCSLGLNGSSNLCNSVPQCNVCSIIKNGFKVPGLASIAAGTGGSSPLLVGGVAGKGILTTATSGKAHDRAEISSENQEKRAMLVCRVIAGRVKKSQEGNLEEFDSVAGGGGVYSNLDELYVFNPKAILPCFVVVYRGF